MGWVLPRTYTTGEVITASIANTNWRDQLRYLKGLDGDITIEANLITAFNVDGVDVSAHKAGTAKAQHDGGAGTHTHQTSGAEGAKIDHGAALNGLGDADHSAYQAITLLTTRGDIIYRNATVWARRAKGTSGQVLTMDANDPVWSGQNTIVFSTASLFSGTAPLSYTDLNISSTVGSNQALCLIKVFNNSGDATTQSYNFRKDDDGDNFNTLVGVSSAASPLSDQRACYFIIVTDATGVVEWRSNATKTTVITMEAYLI